MKASELRNFLNILTNDYEVFRNGLGWKLDDL